MNTMNPDAADRASESDRRFFEANPNRTYRVRPAHDGEMPEMEAPGSGWICIAVRQLAPGVRVRICFIAPTLPFDTEELGAAVFARRFGHAGAKLTCCGVTVLRTLGKGSATKTWTWNPTMQAWTKRAYAMGKDFRVEYFDVDGIRSLGTLIEHIQCDATAFIIRGALVDGSLDALDPSKKLGVHRRYLVTVGKPPPDFRDVPRQWLCADIDGWQIPDGLDLVEDVDLVIERAIAELLPAPFHDCEAFWQLSSSAGFAPGVLKAHLWFWLHRSVETPLLKTWMKLHAPAVDSALFNPVQIHYTACPIVHGGPDPIPQRTGWVQGERDAVTLPDMDAERLAADTAQLRRQTASAAGLSPSQATTVAGALAALGDGDGLDGFHDPLRRAAWMYARETAPWGRMWQC